MMSLLGVENYDMSISRSGASADIESTASARWRTRADGGGGARLDIIDLDHYMRGGSVREVTPPCSPRRKDGDERLVVDGGGARKVTRGDRTPSESSASTGSRRKRLSHDSGLSDGSYGRRARKPSRRITSTRTRTNSDNSMRNFQKVCERALREQQEQIARVAQICERLSVCAAAPASRPTSRPAARAERSRRSSRESSLSSSSRSTPDPRRGKDRPNECKTYKIIMGKLDELNRLFVARGRAGLPGQPGAVAAVIASPIAVKEPPQPPVAPQSVSRGIGDSAANSAAASADAQPTRPVSVGPATPRLATRRALQLDIAPLEALPRSRHGDAPSPTRTYASARRHGDMPPTPRRHGDVSPRMRHGDAPASPRMRKSGRLNVATESVMQCSSSSALLPSNSSRGADHTYDLDCQIYDQSKHPEVMSYPRSPRHPPTPRTPSLCKVVWSYWRALRQCLASHVSRVYT